MTDTIHQVVTQSQEPTPTEDSPKAWITIAELQEHFGIGRTTAYKWAGELPSDVCMRIGSKKLLINERKLISYLERKGRQNVLR
ncbi:MAG: helix-turn-helix domain-containing protein [Coriobacteriia bacterium]|nr:helix-turn-helix domain-containing protein [Coriobacteriia bacterium]MCL2750182.1 helix-turn-helix domain-containing protein [Coriobacteriia bacterium]